MELTVNLPKLEPFILSEDELEPHEQESGSSEHWTLSPSPPQSPSLNSQSSGSFFSRSLQGFPPIREAGEQASFSVGGSVGRRRASSMKSPPKSPSNPSIVVETSSPSGVTTLPHLVHTVLTMSMCGCQWVDNANCHWIGTLYIIVPLLMLENG